MSDLGLALFVKEGSIGLVLTLGTLAVVQYLGGWSWWWIALSLVLAAGLLWCGWALARDAEGSRHD